MKKNIIHLFIIWVVGLLAWLTIDIIDVKSGLNVRLINTIGSVVFIMVFVFFVRGMWYALVSIRTKISRIILSVLSGIVLFLAWFYIDAFIVIAFHVRIGGSL